jgi:Flp pilus assembly protein TadD
MKHRFPAVLLALFLAAALAVPPAAAQSRLPTSTESTGNMTLAGRVLAADGRTSLDMAIVSLRTMGGMNVMQTTTDTMGRYSFQVGRGVYYVHVEKYGYLSDEQRVEMTMGSQMAINFSLQPDKQGQPGAAAPPGGMVPAGQMAVPPRVQKELLDGVKQLQERGNADRALRHFDRAIQQLPDYAQAHYWKGMAHIELGETAKARDSFHTALKKNEKMGPAHIALGTIHLAENNVPQAIESLEAGLKLTPHDWQGHYELGRALLSQRRLEEAETYAMRAKELNPQFSRADLLLAMIYYTGGQLEKSLAAADKYLEAPDDPELGEQVRQQAAEIRKRLNDQ